MIRLCTALAALPSVATADWRARPSNFSYDPAFQSCAATRPDTCAGALAAAYTLRREITQALLPCIIDGATDCRDTMTNAGFSPIAQSPALSSCSMTAQDLPAYHSDTTHAVVPQTHCIEQIARAIEAPPLPHPTTPQSPAASTGSNAATSRKSTKRSGNPTPHGSSLVHPHCHQIPTGSQRPKPHSKQPKPLAPKQAAAAGAK